ncbi:immunity 53 family protein [Stenotrophomonas sp. CFBP 13718]|uniref:immunity 53 family protein n=1 Tax=Stenotrophomonas sp. CFBP 13718 TaxID=2775304 RepID=UPI001783F994|nr:immunity 53 family protein [Stenotrophomonas sp. CFBP 13718]MBD8696854.1 immunity 53 family protein [Stenotrophomonas sp. CFBP 13718]
MDTAISLLQKWYARHCDEDWEHSYGIKIDTLDNPGWILTVDLADTEFSENLLPRNRVDRSEADWVQSEISGQRYIACGGVFNLEEMVLQFLTFVGERGVENFCAPSSGAGT